MEADYTAWVQYEIDGDGDPGMFFDGVKDYVVLSQRDQPYGVCVCELCTAERETGARRPRRKYINPPDGWSPEDV